MASSSKDSRNQAQMVASTVHLTVKKSPFRENHTHSTIKFCKSKFRIWLDCCPWCPAVVLSCRNNTNYNL